MSRSQRNTLPYQVFSVMTQFKIHIVNFVCSNCQSFFNSQLSRNFDTSQRWVSVGGANIPASFSLHEDYRCC